MFTTILCTIIATAVITLVVCDNTRELDKKEMKDKDTEFGFCEKE